MMKSTDLNSLRDSVKPLKEAFNLEDDRKRLIAIMSPT